LKELINKYNKTNKILNNKINLDKEIEEYNKLYKEYIENKKQYDMLKETIEYYNLYDNKCKQYANEIKDIEKEIEEWKKNNPTCPTCGQLIIKEK
jgi:uncharacterized coiled-coil DUF342 family protein